MDPERVSSPSFMPTSPGRDGRGWCVVAFCFEALAQVTAACRSCGIPTQEEARRRRVWWAAEIPRSAGHDTASARRSMAG